MGLNQYCVLAAGRDLPMASNGNAHQEADLMASTGCTFAVLLGLCIASWSAESIVREFASAGFSRWRLLPWLIPVALSVWFPIHHRLRRASFDCADPFI